MTTRIEDMLSTARRILLRGKFRTKPPKMEDSDSDYCLSDNDQQHSRRSLLHSRRWKRMEGYGVRRRRYYALCGVVSFVLLVCLLSAVGWYRMMAGIPICARTKFYPYKTGCPTSGRCEKLRPNVTKGTEFLRVAVGWRVGALYGLHDHERVFMQAAERLRKRLPGVEPDVIRNYVQLEDELEMNGPKGIESRLQQYFQFELPGICCVTRSEMWQLRQAVKKFAFVHNTTFPVAFNEPKCYHERVNSVNNVILADRKTSDVLGRMYQQLIDGLMATDIPMVVKREEQLPFHINVLEFHGKRRKSIAMHLRELAQLLRKKTENEDVNIEFKVHGKPFLTTVEKLNNWMY